MGLTLAIGAEIAEEEEGNTVEGEARIVGEGKRALGAAEGGLLVILLE